MTIIENHIRPTNAGLWDNRSPIGLGIKNWRPIITARKTSKTANEIEKSRQETGWVKSARFVKTIPDKEKQTLLRTEDSSESTIAHPALRIAAEIAN